MSQEVAYCPAPFAEAVRVAVAAGEVAGAAAAVTTRRTVRMECFGFHNQAERTPVEIDTIFRLGSTAKCMFTAAALSILADHSINLDRGIGEWLPEMAVPRVLRTPTAEIDDTVPAGRQITIRDVLTYQLGIGMYLRQGDTPIFRAMMAAGVSPSPNPVPFGADEFISRLGSLPLAHQPGETFMYHLADDVLRILITRITGQPLQEILAERVFEPLSMFDTGISVPHSKLHRFSTGYLPQTAPGAPLEVADAADGHYAKDPIFPNHLMSTIDDFRKFAQMLLGEGTFGGRNILKPESVALMMTDHLTAAQKERSPAPEGWWEQRGWGMGASVYAQSVPGGPNAGSYSWFGGDGPHYLIDKKRGSAIILMISRAVRSQSGTQLGYEFELEAYRNCLRYSDF
jgi:CubicO group peptidase (beta-lactamase class C family)